MSTPTPEAVARMSQTELDRDLLLQALQQMTGRFIRCAKDFGYDDKLIDACTFFELALINRIQLRVDAETFAEKV